MSHRLKPAPHETLSLSSNWFQPRTHAVCDANSLAKWIMGLVYQANFQCICLTFKKSKTYSPWWMGILSVNGMQVIVTLLSQRPPFKAEEQLSRPIKIYIHRSVCLKPSSCHWPHSSVSFALGWALNNGLDLHFSIGDVQCTFISRPVLVQLFCSISVCACNFLPTCTSRHLFLVFYRLFASWCFIFFVDLVSLWPSLKSGALVETNFPRWDEEQFFPLKSCVFPVNVQQGVTPLDTAPLAFLWYYYIWSVSLGRYMNIKKDTQYVQWVHTSALCISVW